MKRGRGREGEEERVRKRGRGREGEEETEMKRGDIHLTRCITKKNNFHSSGK